MSQSKSLSSVAPSPHSHPHLKLAQHVPSHKERLIIMGAVMMALFLGALDQTIVGTALPKIVTDLGGNNLYVWVVTAYLLTSTITVPIYGKLSDIYGRRRILLIGITIFLLGSALSGLSQNMTELIIFRGLQGLGAGSLFPVSLAVIGDLFSPRERGKYQGLFGAVFGLSFLIGPFLGGYITDSISWHWVFYVNVPIGIAALSIIGALLPTQGLSHRKLALDVWGALVFALAIISILLGLTEKGLTSTNGALDAWNSPEVGGLILLGVALLALFVLIELRVEDPLIHLSLFRSLPFTIINLAALLMSFGMFAAIIFMPRYFQAVLGQSATTSGYQVWPLLIGMMSMSIVAGQLISRTGRYKLLLLAAPVVVGLGMWFTTALTATTPTLLLWLWLGIIGLGLGPSMSAYTLVIQGITPPAQLGMATATVTFMRQMGGTIGLAVAGTLLITDFIQKLPHQLTVNHVPAVITHKIISATSGNLTGVGPLKLPSHQQVPALLVTEITKAVHDALGLAIGDIFWLGVIASIITLATILFLSETPLRGKESMPSPTHL